MRSTCLPVLLSSALVFACSDDTALGDDEVGGETGTGADTGESTGSETGTDTTGTDTDTDTGTDSGGVEPAVEWPTLDCDPLVPDYCGFPFPSNVFSAEDPSSNTGRSLALSQELMPVGAGYSPSPDSFNMSDGFSMASTMLAYFPGATVTGLPTPLTIPDSLGPDSPTVLLNADTGERVPHWAELDMSHENDARRTFMIRPVLHLDADTRYIVAVRGLVDGEGVELPPSPAFEALRDDLASAEPSVEARRGLYLDIFTQLEDAGVGREDLQLAWDFSTASDANITERAVSIRDQGLAAIDPAGPDYVIDDVTLDPAPGLAMRIELTMTVPLFLDSPEAGGAIVYGADGLPEQNGTAEYPVLVHVPTSAADSPATPMAYGHGQLGSRFEITADHLEAFSAQANVVMFATDWIGMASDDQENIVQILATGHIDDFHTVPDRLQQGYLNAFAAMRLVRGKLADDPLLEGWMIDGSEGWYFGGSQGGIYGSSYMALSPDVARGVLAVPGQPYSLLLNRSANFAEFFALIEGSYSDELSLRFLLELVQTEWDRAEPAGYSRHVILDPLPGSFEKEVLTLVSIGDHQVTTLGAHVMARELGIPQLGPANRPDLFAIDVVEQPYMGSAMIEYDFGLPPEPIENVPMTEGEDPHSGLAGVPEAFLTVDQFLRTGVVESFCDGVCDPS